MLAVKSMNIRNNFKSWCKTVSEGETVVISRPKNQNIYMLSEKEYNDLQKAKRNTEYLEMLDKSVAQLKAGEVINISMDELDSRANE